MALVWFKVVFWNAEKQGKWAILVFFRFQMGRFLVILEKQGRLLQAGQASIMGKEGLGINALVWFKGVFCNVFGNIGKVG